MSGSDNYLSTWPLLLLIDLYELFKLIDIFGEITLNELSPLGDLFDFEHNGGLGELFPIYDPT